VRYELGHLDALESEAIHVMRDVAAERERPILLFSGGKDSLVLLRLAEKAFRPARFPFPLLHVDTGAIVSKPARCSMRLRTGASTRRSAARVATKTGHARRSASSRCATRWAASS
jgi:3'-phosphoadenosine 5'-phosphosulfate sulfotransferase (PAPS reductase)/FAD synthetase